MMSDLEDLAEDTAPLFDGANTNDGTARGKSFRARQAQQRTSAAAAERARKRALLHPNAMSPVSVRRFSWESDA